MKTSPIAAILSPLITGVCATASLLFFAAPGESQVPSAPVPYSYADFADLAIPAPIVAEVRIDRATPLKKAAAVGVPAGKTRFYVEASIVALIKGQAGLPGKVAYLADLPKGAGERPPSLPKKSQHIIFASTVPNRPGELRLVAPDAQIPAAPAMGAQIRTILTEAARPDAAPQIAGIGRAFHVPGSLPGESETQLFLLTADGRPVSLSILRRPGELPRWAVSLSEIVDDAAAPPQRDTLLWYRLACTLPRLVPTQSLAESGVAEAAAIQGDYRLVLEGLGPCTRSRRR